ncbi:MAG: carboxypeptidase-like regulatory domain-containing protein [Myxococcota bacterium]
MRLRLIFLLGLTVALTASCGDDDDASDEPCTLGTTEGCDNGQVCEQVADGEPTCFAPVVVSGLVFDVTNDDGVEGANVVAVDANGAARSGVETTGTNGNYELPILVARDEEGNPASTQVTLRVGAQGYQPFPKAPRTALPVNLDSATLDEDNDQWVVQNAATDVGLVPLEGDVGDLGSISGVVELGGTVDGGVASVSGILVVAEVDGETITSVADEDGNFVLFNVPPGEVTVTAYGAGVNVEPQTITLEAGEDVTGITLTASTDGLSTVSGKLEFADASCGDVTSVILVVESTLEELVPGNPAFVRGEAPPGLRVGDVMEDPETQEAGFSIPNVPPGRYAVLAAFENDCLVRDPDEGIANTEVVVIEVPGDGSDVDAGSFKVTGAIEIFEPGATELEVIDDPEPTFTWARDPSTESYELRVFDAHGNLVFENLAVPDPMGGETVSYTYDGPELEEGMIYQFRVLSVALASGDYRSGTEDLLGVFQYDPTPPDATDGGVDGG